MSFCRSFIYTLISILICVSCTSSNESAGVVMFSRVPGVEKTIPYLEAGNSGLMLVEVKIKESDPLRFIFDTGASQSVLFSTPHTERNNLPVNDLPVRSTNPGSNAIPWRSLAEMNLQIGDILLENITLEAAHWSHFPFFQSEEQIWADGIIGFDLLQFVMAEIDRNSMTIRFHDPDTITISEDWLIVGLEIIDKKPYSYANVQVSEDDTLRNVKLHVDLGMAGYLALIPDEENEINIPSNGTFSQGWMNGQVITGSSAYIHKMHFLNRTFENVLTTFPTSGHPTGGNRNGSLGSLILNQFNLVIDFPGGRLAGTPK